MSQDLRFRAARFLGFWGVELRFKGVGFFSDFLRVEGCGVLSDQELLGSNPKVQQALGLACLHLRGPDSVCCKQGHHL